VPSPNPQQLMVPIHPKNKENTENLNEENDVPHNLKAKI
jgi:hypothetical protein